MPGPESHTFTRSNTSLPPVVAVNSIPADPPAGVYFIALPTRLLMIFSTASLSKSTLPVSASASYVNAIPFSAACCLYCSKSGSAKVCRLPTFSCSWYLAESILEISSIWLIRSFSLVVLRAAISSCCCIAGSVTLLCSTSTGPCIIDNGVRISCATLAKNLPLASSTFLRTLFLNVLYPNANPPTDSTSTNTMIMVSSVFFCSCTARFTVLSSSSCSCIVFLLFSAWYCLSSFST